MGTGIQLSTSSRFRSVAVAIPRLSSQASCNQHQHQHPMSLPVRVAYPLASKIMVRNLRFAISENRLQEEFSRFGEVAEVEIVKDERTMKSKGFAFIQYNSQENAILAVENMDHQLLDGRKIFVDLAKPLRKSSGGYLRTCGPPGEVNSPTETKSKGQKGK